MGSNGPPLPNLTVKFMSPDGEEVPTGEEGEVWIAGPSVFKGYHNNPAATASSKTPDGFFKTGDLGYEDEHGNMYITDRVKELIKFKGFQVAPAELEGLLMGHDAVQDVAVVGVYDERIASEVPLAFVVLREGMERNEENGRVIVKWLEDKVAGHKRLRGGVKWIDEIPKTASGKILRRMLKDVLAKEAADAKVKAKL
jgi:4-coumarate--CoA ligase